jgi:predicted neutral ceramidase superfamily lipid hydrolase
MVAERAEYSKADLARDYFLWFVLRIAAPFIPVIIHWVISENLAPKQSDFFKFPNETIILSAFIVPLATAKDTKSYWGIWLSFFAATTSIVLYTLAIVAKAQQLSVFFPKICRWGLANFILVSVIVSVAEFYLRVLNKVPPKVITEDRKIGSDIQEGRGK